MAKRKSFRIINGQIPSGMWKELSGINEMNGMIGASKSIGLKLVIAAKTGIKNSPKIGKVYYRRGVGKTRASLAGGYPANQSGDLQRSVKYKMQGFSKLRFGAEEDYAKYLQFSDTPKRIRKKERPLLTMAHRQVKKSFKRIMRAEVESEI